MFLALINISLSNIFQKMLLMHWLCQNSQGIFGPIGMNGLMYEAWGCTTEILANTPQFPHLLSGLLTAGTNDTVMLQVIYSSYSRQDAISLWKHVYLYESVKFKSLTLNLNPKAWGAKCDFNPSSASGLFGQYKIMHKTFKMTETLTHGYSSEFLCFGRK